MFLDFLRATLLWLMIAPLAFSQYAVRLVMAKRIRQADYDTDQT
jgi:hypothetical protein